MKCADCEREFELCTELQRKRGGEPWRCPTCRFNAAGKAFVGFVARPVPVAK